MTSPKTPLVSDAPPRYSRGTTDDTFFYSGRPYTP